MVYYKSSELVGVSWMSSVWIGVRATSTFEGSMLILSSPYSKPLGSGSLLVVSLSYLALFDRF